MVIRTGAEFKLVTTGSVDHSVNCVSRQGLMSLIWKLVCAYTALSFGSVAEFGNETVLLMSIW